MTPQEFRQTRGAMEMTQTELAKAMGMSLRAIQDIEKGTAPVRQVHVLALRFLSLETAALLSRPEIALPEASQAAIDYAGMKRPDGLAQET